jgi:hypothetical protein
MPQWNDDVRNSLVTLVSGGQNALNSGLTPILAPLVLDITKSSGLPVVVDVDVTVSSGLNIRLQSGSPVSIQSGTYINIGSGVGVVTSVSGNYVSMSGVTAQMNSGLALFVQNSSNVGAWTTAVISSGQTLSAEVDLTKSFSHLNITAPSMTSGTVSIQSATASGGTFQVLGDAWSVGAGSKNATLTLGMWQYLKLSASVAQSAAVTYNVRGVTY